MAKKKSEALWKNDMPVTLYAHQDSYAEGREEFSCFLTAADAVEDDGPTLVGVYRLVEVRRLQKRIEAAK